MNGRTPPLHPNEDWATPLSLVGLAPPREGRDSSYDDWGSDDIIFFARPGLGLAEDSRHVTGSAAGLE